MCNSFALNFSFNWHCQKGTDKGSLNNCLRVISFLKAHIIVSPKKVNFQVVDVLFFMRMSICLGVISGIFLSRIASLLPG